MERSVSLPQRATAYVQLSMYERKLLTDWIRANITREIVWEYTSVGLQSLFEESEFGFPITHEQMQQALLLAGCYPEDSGSETWVIY